MTKSELRNKYMQKRKTLSEDEVLSLSENIFLRFKEEFTLVANQKVHCFLPITEKNEVNTRFFIGYFFSKNIRVFVPKIDKGKMISVEIFPDTVLRTSLWGIPEPESTLDSGETEFDYVITPLLYCDETGNRVGYGKGFYDDLFKNINKDAEKIGVNFYAPEEEIEDFYEEDVPLDYLITPFETLSFGN